MTPAGESTDAPAGEQLREGDWGANRLSPMRFVVWFGVVSLLADFVYEGARSVTGPFLASAGASAALVGVVAGGGEALAVTLRLGSGILADRTKRYWAITLAGYGVTLLAVPALAFTGPVWLICVLVVAERFGKGLRSPAKDSMLAHAGTRLGQGFAFAVHEALDQTGALVGPLVVAGVLALSGGFRTGFAVLGVPAAVALLALGRLRRSVPRPDHYEAEAPELHGGAHERGRLGPNFWLYATFTAITMAGFATFALLGYHLQRHHVIAQPLIPILYAAAMGVGALAALACGRLYDRYGLVALGALPPLAVAVPFLSFSTRPALVWIGAVVWGVAMGVHESTMRAAVADLAAAGARATAYGIFNAVYGWAWLAGSAVIGLLYAHSVNDVALFTVCVEALALVVFIALMVRNAQRMRGST